MTTWTAVFFLTGIAALRAQVQSLQEVRNEIQRLESELKQRETREKSLLEQIEDTDREIGLRHKLLQALEWQKQEQERGIRETETRLQTTSQSYQRLKALVAQRMVSMYKRGRMADWEVLFSISSFSQAMVWLKYQKIIVASDRRSLRLLQEKGASIQAQGEKLEKELREKRRLIQEEETETRRLEDKKTSRKRLLAQVREDKEYLLEKLRRTRLAYKEIEGRINREEQRRRTSTERVSGTGFAALRGKMGWPVEGKVVSKYGRQKHPVLNTWTENLGIDIEAADRGIVRAVSRGRVRWVTWQRGMGNLVLLDHGEGYYTVYGHLDLVYVGTGEDVGEGGVIGRLGDRQSLAGSTLHFQVWNGTRHYNPEQWLR